MQSFIILNRLYIDFIDRIRYFKAKNIQWLVSNTRLNILTFINWNCSTFDFHSIFPSIFKLNKKWTKEIRLIFSTALFKANITRNKSNICFLLQPRWKWINKFNINLQLLIDASSICWIFFLTSHTRSRYPNGKKTINFTQTTFQVSTTFCLISSRRRLLSFFINIFRFKNWIK